MKYQPKTRKYRFSFRNKVDKKQYKKQVFLIHSAKSDKNFFLKTRSLGHSLNSAFASGAHPSQTLVTITNIWSERVSKITSTFLQPNACLGKVKNSKQGQKQNLFFANKSEQPSLHLTNYPELATTLSSSSMDKIRFGSYGIFFTSFGSISTKFINSTVLFISKKKKKTGRFWCRITADTPVTARSAETRMGRGKGAISGYEAKIRPGQMFLEFSGVKKENINAIYSELAKKTAFSIKLV